MKNGKLKIFVSYTVRDGVIDQSFLLRLEEIIDKFCYVYIDLIHNDSLNKQKRVINELENSNLLFLIKTNETNNSEWVNKEIDIAKNLNIPILEFDYKTLIKKEFLPITKAIRNAGKVLNMNIIAVNKINSKLKVGCFKIPHYA